MTRRGAAWRMGAPVRLMLVALIRLYRSTIGLFLGGRCRFHPSCSAYAEQAVAELGVLRGGSLAVWRVLRCGPWTAGGIDHPPVYDRVISTSRSSRVSDSVIRVGRTHASGARS
jgi:uncharacterized protein